MSRPTALMRLGTALLLVATHAAVAAVVVGTVYQHYLGRRDAVDALRERLDSEQRAATQLEHRVSVQEAQRDALQRGDDYVIELLARARIGYVVQPGEVSPPPLHTGPELPLPGQHAPAPAPQR